MEIAFYVFIKFLELHKYRIIDENEEGRITYVKGYEGIPISFEKNVEIIPASVLKRHLRTMGLTEGDFMQWLSTIN